MKKNIRLLIIASILGLIALSCIQAYLINNTYKLEKDAFLSETKSAIFRFDDRNAEIEAIYDAVGDFIVNRIIDYKKGSLPKNELLNGINKVQDSVNSKYIALYQAEFARLKLSHPVEFQKRLKSLIILDSTINDTLFYQKHKEKSLYVLGKSFSFENAYSINNSQTTTDLNQSYIDNNGEQRKLNLDFQIVTIDYFSIDGWKREVLKRMSGILALSIFIFALVLGLLYYAIKSLISQKKIADVKTDFINNITHELKTPLATLALSTKMLKNDAVKTQPDIMESTVNTIDRQTHRLQKLIDQVLDNSLGYQDITLKKETVELSSYLKTVLEDFKLSVKGKTVEIRSEIDTENTTIDIDKFYFTTALFNILENAVKYNSENVNIHFEARLKKDLSIKILDNGIGIPKQAQQQIFDKFYRAGDQDEHNVKGLGLGLYYTNQIIKAHSGNITVESKEGQGTMFKITIPI